MIVRTLLMAALLPSLAFAVDADADGFDATVDCDDANADVYPGAPEIMDNLVDEDCDGFDRSATCDVDVDFDVTPNQSFLVDTCTLDDRFDGRFGTGPELIARFVPDDYGQVRVVVESDVLIGSIGVFMDDCSSPGTFGGTSANAPGTVSVQSSTNSYALGDEQFWLYETTDGACGEVVISVLDCDNDDDVDGLNQCAENSAGTSDTIPDTDADGILDGADACPFDPTNVDSDGDGVCELRDVCIGDDSTGDSDGDGVCDLELYVDTAQVGEPLVLEVLGAPEGAEVRVYASVREGSTCFGNLGCLGLRNPILLGSFTGSQGEVEGPVLPANLPDTARVQAVFYWPATRTLAVSEVRPIEED